MLTKKDFIDRLAEKGYTKKDAALITDDVLNEISEILASGESIRFHGFGTFEVKEMAEKRIRTPHGEVKIVDSYHIPRFYAGNGLKKMIRVINPVETE